MVFGANVLRLWETCSLSNGVNLKVHEANPQETWDALNSNPSAILVDVRTIAEWDYVGVPVLDSVNKEMLKVEWQEFPEMTLNEEFADEVLAQLGATDPSEIYFICRSGQRSHFAAKSLLEKLDGSGRIIRCYNVTEGFEGNRDENSRRGTINGWKVRGLPWDQQ